ncbi:winged helix family two component transcriptional regulator [Sulfuritortus calidifontis]|uniref:Winged helix family two component transcriptional regulator n=1 Tax=Sulfuritortus calidifontis TaxID=1914471 RepID=A0A4R3JTW1_9PROT|nr:response regulator transcription factor [Sulfuritortus calidifontis]TCS70910.1 winged helix family two component transcriptional regulator [Sulfuritortus calidifontis]
MRLLVVEDDALLGDAVQNGLRQAGYAADWVRDGAAAEAALAAGAYAAVVLDLGLPRRSGLEVLRGLRGRGDTTPVLILTARDAIEDRIAGLDAGADDYLVKPFDMGELAARLRALIRRAGGQPVPVLKAQGVELDPAAHRVSFQGQPVELSAREFALLHALLLHAGRVLTRPQIEEALYAWGEEIESNAVEVYIHHLRRKLDARLIQTVRGVGYLIAKDAHG